MYQVNFTSHILEDGSINPNVPINSLGIYGSNLPFNAAVNITFQTENFSTTTDANGSLNYLVNITTVDNQAVLHYIGTTGSWSDNNNIWIATSNDVTLTIELVQ